MNTPKLEHMSWTKEAWTGISKFIFSWRQTWVKCVGEHFIYLCIPEFLPVAFIDGSFEAVAGETSSIFHEGKIPQNEL